MKNLLAFALVVFLTACGASGLDGTYTDETGMASYTFTRGGKVTLKMVGVETETDYRVEDGKVKIGSPQGALVMPILADGSIQGPLGVILRKTE